MKIIGRSERGAIVEMDDDELARAAGYYSANAAREKHPEAIRKTDSYDYQFRIGTTIPVSEMYQTLTKLHEQEARLKDAAGMLRTMADMMTSALPETLIAPPSPPVERCVPKKVPE